jgi:hypothetical protein
MGYTRFRQLVLKARPFFRKRGDNVAHPFAAPAVPGIGTERLLTLLAANDEPTQRGGVTREVEWAECVFVPVLEIEGQPQPR